MISPVRSAKYLKFVRGQECAFCVCSADEAHHAVRLAGGGGLGIKGCDLLAIPLCRRHHRELHKRGTVGELDQSELWELVWKSIALSLRAYHLQETA